MKDLVRPYADVDGIFESVEYRGNLSEAFQPLDIEDGVAARVVLVDDLRIIPQHQLRIRLGLDALKPHYGRHKSSVIMAVVVRDTILRRELRLAEFPVDAVPSIVELDRAALRTTGLRDVLPIDLVVLWNGNGAGAKALPQQRASRLAELRIVLRNTAGGASFPYKRASAEDFKNEGLPPETAVHLKLVCDAVELIKESDTPIKNLFEVWLHEKLWSALQNDRSHIASPLRLSTVTLTTCHLLLSSVVPQLRKGQLIEAGSAIGQLLDFVDKQAGQKEGYLRQKFEANASLNELDPYLQNAWRFLTNSGKIEEELTE